MKWVLIRGLVRSRKHWNDFPKNLQNFLNTSVDCVELSGNGFLSEQKTPTDIKTAVDSLREQANLTEPVGLLGISLGGMLAVKWAQLYPQEVSRLVLINSSSDLSSFYQRLFPHNYAGIIKMLLQHNPEATERFILSVSSNEPAKWQPLVTGNTEFHREHPVTASNFIRQLLLTSQVDFSQVPHCPKLILASSTDRLVNPVCSSQIAKKWNCKIQHHPTAGHDLPLDDELWVLNQIKDFLSKSAESIGE